MKLAVGVRRLSFLMKYDTFHVVPLLWQVVVVSVWCVLCVLCVLRVLSVLCMLCCVCGVHIVCCVLCVVCDVCVVCVVWCLVIPMLEEHLFEVGRWRAAPEFFDEI